MVLTQRNFNRINQMYMRNYNDGHFTNVRLVEPLDEKKTINKRIL